MDQTIKERVVIITIILLMMWTVTVELKNLVIILVTVEFKNHRIIRVGKELWRSSSPKLLPWQHSPQVYQSLPSGLYHQQTRE